MSTTKPAESAALLFFIFPTRRRRGNENENKWMVLRRPSRQARFDIPVCTFRLPFVTYSFVFRFGHGRTQMAGKSGRESQLGNFTKPLSTISTRSFGRLMLRIFDLRRSTFLSTFRIINN